MSDMENGNKKRKAPESPSDSQNRRNVLLPVGEQLSDSVTVFHQTDLELGGQCPNNLDAVYGMENIKKLLRDCIELPLLAPQHYRVVSQLNSNSSAPIGKRELERVFAIYGQRGSGKMLLILTFCLLHNLTLIVIGYAGFDPERDIKLAYEYAEQNTSCLVVLDECEGSFHKESAIGAYNAGILQNWLAKVHRSTVPIWTILICSVVPDLNTLQFAIHTFISYSVWCGELNDADREKCFRAAINRYLYPGQQSPLSDRELTGFVGMSRHCSAGDIFKFVKSVFLYRIKQVEFDLSVMEQSDEALVPTVDDFSLMITRPGEVGRDRITKYDPRTFNIAPYSKTSANDADEEAQYGF